MKNRAWFLHSVCHRRIQHGSIQNEDAPPAIIMNRKKDTEMKMEEGKAAGRVVVKVKARRPKVKKIVIGIVTIIEGNRDTRVRKARKVMKIGEEGEAPAATENTIHITRIRTERHQIKEAQLSEELTIHIRRIYL